MPNYSFQSSGIAFSPPRFFCFSFPLFFLYLGHLLGYLLVGKDFAKHSRIMNFFWRKYQWVVGQDFHWNFLLKVTRFLSSFSGLFDWIALIWVWLERSHLPAQGSCQSCPGPLKLMSSQVVQGTWLKKGGYGRFRGQCVKQNMEGFKDDFTHLKACNFQWNSKSYNWLLLWHNRGFNWSMSGKIKKFCLLH